jgi:Glycosyl transferases group 1
VPASFTLDDEVALMRGFDVVTTVGPADAARVSERAPELRVLDAPFCATIEPQPRPVRSRANGLLLACSRGPVFDASFRWFYEQVWPILRARRPGTTLTVVGWISELARHLGADTDPGVVVRGIVADIEPVYDATDVVLAPYYYGDGVKTKIIEALARGLPVVTTPPGLSNTRLEPGRDILVAADAASYAAMVSDLLDSERQRAALSASGLAYVRVWHRPETSYQGLRAAIATLIEPRRDERPVPATTMDADLGRDLRRLVPWAISRCLRDGIRRVAFFGAGQHTRLLLPLWRALGGPAFAAVVVSGTPQELTCYGLPVRTLADLDLRDVDAIVLSSRCHEGEMADACRAAWPDLPFYSIWLPPGVWAAAMGAASLERPTLESRVPNFASDNSRGAQPVLPGEEFTPACQRPGN